MACHSAYSASFLPSPLKDFGVNNRKFRPFQLQVSSITNSARASYNTLISEVLKAVLQGDSVIFNEHPELMDAVVCVYFHSSLPKYNRMECWGPLTCASEWIRKWLGLKSRQEKLNVRRRRRRRGADFLPIEEESRERCFLFCIIN